MSVFIFRFACVLPSIVLSSTFQGTVNLGKASSGVTISPNVDARFANTGNIVANLGDFNGDGFTDVGMFSACNFYVLFGSSSGISESLPDLTASTGFSITGDILTVEACQYPYQSNIAALGDINDDCRADIIIAIVLSVAELEPIYYIIYGTGHPSNINLDD
jgi:hypothetical protein